MKAKAIIHFFFPGSNWDWYVSEGSYVDADGFFDTEKEKVDFLFFGLVNGHDAELGYFSLSELEKIRFPVSIYRGHTQKVIGSFQYGIERDLHWTPQTLETLWEKHTKQKNSEAA